MLEDGTLIDAVAAPGAGQAQDRHSAGERRQDLPLLCRQRDLLEAPPPARSVLFRAVAGQEVRIAQALPVLVEQIHRLAATGFEPVTRGL